MRTIRALAALAFLTIQAKAADPIPLMLQPTNSVIYLWQSNFFDANISLLTNALVASGWSSGEGGGAATNVAAADITDAGTVGILLVQATNAAAGRTALELGTAATSASTAFEPAGVSASDITDSTAAGRALLTAVDAAAQRTALALGTAATNPASAFATPADVALRQAGSSVLTNVAALTSGTATNFLAGDGVFRQVTTNMIPGLVAALASGGGGATNIAAADITDVTATGIALITAESPAGARLTLELGTAATNDVSAFATPADVALRQLGTAALTNLSAGDGSALTNLNGDNIASGTVAEARIASTMATDVEVAAAVSVKQSSAAFAAPTRLVIEGDSLSTGYAIDGLRGWNYYISNSHMASLGMHWGANAATAGQSVSTMLTDYATQVEPYAPSGGTNAVLFFWGGINDLSSAGAAVTWGRISNYWVGAKADGFTLVGFTITDSTNLPETNRAEIATLNNLIRYHAPTYCDYLVDVAEILNDCEDTQWASDGVHWNENASKILASHIASVVSGGRTGQEAKRITGSSGFPANRHRLLSVIPQATPDTSGAAGLIGFDNNAWASGRGAVQVNDGTAAGYLLSALASDTPSNGQVPTFNTGGTITWEPAPSPSITASAVGAPASATNIVLDFGHDALTYTVTNNVNLIQSTNRPASSANADFVALRLTGDTVDRTLSWHSSWKRLGTNITVIPSNKVVVVSAMVIGDAETGVTFGIAKEE